MLKRYENEDYSLSILSSEINTNKPFCLSLTWNAKRYNQNGPQGLRTVFGIFFLIKEEEINPQLTS